MHRMNVLVTGGNRYIGLELVRTLAAAGHHVTVINSHEVPMPDGVQRLHADRRIAGEFTRVLTPHRDRFDAVYDNTAFTVDDLAPMLELFRGRVQQYVFTSSTAVYRRSFVQPILETFRLHDPTDDDHRKAYGVNKVRCEQLLLAEHASSGMGTTSLRVSHTMGPRSPLVTRDPIFFARLEQGRPIFLPGEGQAFMSLIHIADVASLMLSILDDGDGSAGQVYNVTGSEVCSIAAAVHFMAKAVGVEANVVPVPLDIARAQRPPLVHWNEATFGGLIFSNHKALEELNWTPRFGIETGYRNSYRWFDDGGRDLYEYDFSHDDALLADLV
jgi:nucleoside-diphosphate-sugar epimerase